MKWSTQILTWGSTLVVMRLLAPEDYGLIGMSAVFLGFVQLVSEFGFGYAVVILRDLTRSQFSQLHGASLLLGILATLLSFLAAHPLGLFFDSPQLPAVVAVSGLNFTLTSLRIIPQGILQKELEFRMLAVMEGVAAILTAAITVVFAFLGFGYWSLIIGNLVGSLLQTLWSAALAWRPLERPHLGVIGRAVSFGGDLTVARIAWYGYSNFDFLVVGKAMGEGPLGAYTVAWTLASLPIEKITALVGRVTNPIFAAAKADPTGLRRYVLRITEAVGLVVFPAAVGLAVVASDFVPLVLGDHWTAAVLPLQVLCLSVPVRSINPILVNLVQALEESRFVAKLSIWMAVILPAGFLIGLRWGLVGVALVWVTVYPLLLIPLLRVAKAHGVVTMVEYFGSTVPSLTASAVMAGGILALNHFAPASTPAGVRLGIDVATGVLLYAGTHLVFFRGRTMRLFHALKHLRRG